MSKLSQSCGKSKVFTIGEVEIELNSGWLNIEDLPSLMILTENSENNSVEEKQRKGQIIADLLKKILKKSVPDASDDEIKEFSLKNIKPLMMAIVEMSGLKNATD
jgi:hypothetical protein